MTARNSRFDVIGQLASLRRHTSSLTHSDTDAEDLVQNAVLRAYQKRASFRDGASLRSWLLSILHNVFIDGRRARETPARCIECIADRRDQFLAPAQEHHAQLAQARRTFVALPEAQRAVLHLVAIERLTFANADSVLDIPEGALLSHLACARAVLRAVEEEMAGSTTVNVAKQPHLKIVGGSDGRPH